MGEINEEGSFLQEMSRDVNHMLDSVPPDVVHAPIIVGAEVASLIDTLRQYLELLVAHILMDGQSHHLFPQKQPSLALLAVVDPASYILERDVQRPDQEIDLSWGFLVVC